MLIEGPGHHVQQLQYRGGIAARGVNNNSGSVPGFPAKVIIVSPLTHAPERNAAIIIGGGISQSQRNACTF